MSSIALVLLPGPPPAVIVRELLLGRDAPSDLVASFQASASEDALVRRDIRDELRAIVPSIEVQSFASPHLVLQRRPRETAARILALMARS